MTEIFLNVKLILCETDFSRFEASKIASLTDFVPFRPFLTHFDHFLQEEHPREPEHHHHSTPKIPVDPMRKKRAVSEEISHHRMRYAKKIS